MKKFDDKFRRFIDNVTGPVPIPNVSKRFRHEYKYLLNRYDFYKCKDVCAKYMQFDEYADENGMYFINSLYLDSVGLKDYYDKDAGAYDRKKMRIRNYGYDLDWAHLEMKRKIDIWEYKDKVKLEKEEVYEIARGDFSCLLNKGTETAVQFYTVLSEGIYRPSCTVEYDRMAFVMPFEDVRITFDTDIRYSNSDFDLFKPKVLTPLYPDKFVVFEIKYNEFLPLWARRLLSTVNKQGEAVSKYCFSKAMML